MAKRTRSYRFEMPYQVEAPNLTDAAAGIDRLLMRGRHDRQVSSLTLLDTTDERLSRAGVLLIHQIVGDTGHWLLRASQWQPWLPAERIEPLDEGDELPEDLVELLMPFRRRASIGPVAGVSVERAAYVVLDPDGVELGQLLDDRVTARRGGLAVARHREVTLECGEPMTSQQRSLLVDRLSLAGGVRVADFPDPTERLAELTHPVPVPEEPPAPAELSPEDYLEWLFASRLHSVWRADLQVRKGEIGDTALLTGELTDLADVVRGLEILVDPVWAGELLWHIDRVVGQPARSRVEELGEAYLDFLDELASAVRSPRLRAQPSVIEAPEGAIPAGARALLRFDAANRVVELINGIDSLAATGSDAAWSQALEQAEQLVRVLNAGGPVLGKVAGRRRRIVRLLGALGGAVNHVPQPDAEALAALSGAEAYQAGRDYQQGLDEVRTPRTELLDAWPRTRVQVLGAWPEVRGAAGVPARLAGAPRPTPGALTRGDQAEGSNG